MNRLKFQQPRLFVTLSALFAFSLAGAAHAKTIETTEGTSATELQAAGILPAPSTLKVAVLPFYDAQSDVTHVQMASAANQLLFARHGFQMTPLLESFAAVKKDGDVEPGLPLRKSDALRIGKKLGVNWVVYGEIKEMRPYKKESFFGGQSKFMWASMRLAVMNVDKEELLFWQARSRRIGGTGFNKGFSKKGEQLVRTGVLSVSDQSFQALMDALPKHETKGDLPDSGDLAKFINETWGEAK